jgi:signal peptidase I
LIAGLLACVAVLRRLFLIVRVEGSSMVPAIQPGERLLILRLRLRVRVGSIVALRPPFGSRASAGVASGYWLIKRVVALSGEPMPAVVLHQYLGQPQMTVPEGSIVVLGDDPASQDSKQWGPIPRALVAGIMVRRLGAR